MQLETGNATPTECRLQIKSLRRRYFCVFFFNFEYERNRKINILVMNSVIEIDHGICDVIMNF